MRYAIFKQNIFKDIIVTWKILYILLVVEIKSMIPKITFQSSSRNIPTVNSRLRSIKIQSLCSAVPKDWASEWPNSKKAKY